MAMNFNSAVDALMKEVNLAVEQGYQAATPDLDILAYETRSGSLSNVYPFLGSMPEFKEWTGNRDKKNLKQYAFTIPNKKFEATIEISRDSIEDDITNATNMGMMQGRMIGEASRLQQTKLIAALLKIGDFTKGYDGQYFFDTDHPLYPKNDGTGTASNQSNKGGGGGTPWYLFDLSSSVRKPFIFQVRQPTRFDAVTATNQDPVFTTDKIQIGLSRRCNAGYAFWQAAYMSKQTLSEAELFNAVASMRGLKKDGESPIGVNPTHIIVPPSLEKVARQVVAAPINSAGATNIGATIGLQLVISPYLA